MFRPECFKLNGFNDSDIKLKMPVGRNGIRRILEGVVNFHQGLPPLESKDTPIPRHVMINCVDPRYSPSKYAQLSINEMFLLRNAGNLVPHSSFVDIQSAATEPAVLELAFTMFEGVKQVRGETR